VTPEQRSLSQRVEIAGHGRASIGFMRPFILSGFLLVAVCSGWAQLIPTGAPVPRGSKLPVVFINGYQNLCPVQFSDTFGTFDQVLQSNGEVSLFFSTCSMPQTASIEDLGAALGSFLSGLRYPDGQAVDQVDIVAHSMGGLVLRSYLSGKQNAAGVFQPPATTHVRRAVFLATPHFGTGVGLLFGFTAQAGELASGSRFLFDLATWNQGTDDLRGIDAIAAVGNADIGTNTVLGTMPGFDDGVVALTSASLRFYMPGRTRVVPFCHVKGGGLVTLAGLCPTGAVGIANIQSATQDAARIVVSFFNGTDDWKNVGVPPENDRFLSVDGGLDVTARTADDAELPLKSVTAAGPSLSKQLNISSSGDVAYTDLFPAGQVTLTAVAGTATAANTVTLPAGGTQPYTVKPGPLVAGVFPAAARVFPLSLAPGMFVAIYGTSLAATTAKASALPLPLQLSDTQVLLNGSPISLHYASGIQINAVLPDTASGLAKLTVRNGGGSHTANVLIETAVPAIFTRDSSGSGPAAALNALDNSVNTPTNPLHAGDYVELFATGLGRTTLKDGLEYANQQPTVSIAGMDCPVTFAGRAPGFPGVDQINCVVPAGIGSNSAAPVAIVSGNRTSNIATLAVQ
jgi:uncharacterized protein (TIGR03437 family)